jgi:tetratricopeptide (TPR) repeat protein
MPREPRSPQIFFGRDPELAQIIDMIFANLGSRPARIAILGPGGYGKTTLANAVLTHHRVQQHFGDARYFVSCESIFSSGALLTELAKTLGLLDGATDVSWSRIRIALDTKDCILCFDNFESPWDQDADIRNSVEELLSRVTELWHVSVLITMRGAVRPAQTQWTMPLLPPLTTLDHDAARRVWEQTVNNFDASAEELTRAVDYVPLAISLLAHLAQAISPEFLLKLWHSRRTAFIYTGQENKLSNLEYSIQLSIDSSRMRANPSAKELLGVLSMLPDGMHIQQVERFKGILSKIDILSGISTLQECGIINVIGERYQTHPIIRNFCNNHSLISKELENALIDFYINLASTRSSYADASSYAEMVLEVNNTKAILLSLLRAEYSDYTKLVEAISNFTEFHDSIGEHSDDLISQSVVFLQQKDASTSLIIDCLAIWGKLYSYVNNFRSAKCKLEEAERLCKASQGNSGQRHADILLWLGDIALNENALIDAKVLYQNALEIYQDINSLIGQGHVYYGLGEIDRRLCKQQEAKALYQKALEFHSLSNDIQRQGNDYQALGNIYVQLNMLQEAKASFQKALEYLKLANSILGQGNTYNGLGDMYFKLNDLPKAEVSYKKALKLHKLSNDSVGQGNALYGLGRVQMARSQLQDAKILFEDALALHKQAQSATAQANDEKYLNEVSQKMEQF